jgi:hypothetical protein
MVKVLALPKTFDTTSLNPFFSFVATAILSLPKKISPPPDYVP